VEQDVRVPSAGRVRRPWRRGGDSAGHSVAPGQRGVQHRAEHIEAARLAPAQLPRRVLIRTDSGGGTHAFLAWLVGRRLHYSVGMAITEDMTTAILARRIGLCGVFRLEYQAAMSGI